MTEDKNSARTWKIYKDPLIPQGAKIMGYKGSIHPRTEQEVTPALQKLLQGGIEHLQKLQSQGKTEVAIEETLGFLNMVMEYTKPNPHGNMDAGYYYMPYPALKGEPRV